MQKAPSAPPICEAESCSALATLYHHEKPYCGKHALELLEAGERAETPADVLNRLDAASAARRKMKSLS
jgi:hypothetical protein